MTEPTAWEEGDYRKIEDSIQAARRLEELARDFYNTHRKHVAAWDKLPIGPVGDDTKGWAGIQEHWGDSQEHWRETMRRFLAKHPEMGATPSSPQPDSGDHELAETTRHKRTFVYTPPLDSSTDKPWEAMPSSMYGSPLPGVYLSPETQPDISKIIEESRSDYAGLPPTDERIEELARDLRQTAQGMRVNADMSWGDCGGTTKEYWRECARHILAKYPGLIPCAQTPPATVEELAQELCAAIADLWSGVPWGALCDTEREKNRIIIRRLLAKHPALARAELSPTCAAHLIDELAQAHVRLETYIGTPQNEFIVGRSEFLDIASRIEAVQDALRRVRDADPKPPQPDLLAQVERLLDNSIKWEDGQAATWRGRLASYGEDRARLEETTFAAQELVRAGIRRECLRDVQHKIATLAQNTQKEKTCATQATSPTTI